MLGGVGEAGWERRGGERRGVEGRGEEGWGEAGFPRSKDLPLPVIWLYIALLLTLNQQAVAPQCDVM